MVICVQEEVIGGGFLHDMQVDISHSSSRLAHQSQKAKLSQETTKRRLLLCWRCGVSDRHICCSQSSRR
jgi:hypothetical protein